MDSGLLSGLCLHHLPKNRDHACPCMLTHLLTVYMFGPAVMSANERTETVFECIRGGAEDYLLKPVTKKEVQHMWQHVWRRQQQNALRVPHMCPEDVSYFIFISSASQDVWHPASRRVFFVTSGKRYCTTISWICLVLSRPFVWAPVADFQLGPCPCVQPCASICVFFRPTV